MDYDYMRNLVRVGTVSTIQTWCDSNHDPKFIINQIVKSLQNLEQTEQSIDKWEEDKSPPAPF